MRSIIFVGLYLKNLFLEQLYRLKSVQQYKQVKFNDSRLTDKCIFKYTHKYIFSEFY